jgi:hypothetical protein
MPVRIFVEGESDQKFITDYVYHLISVTLNKNDFILLNGISNLPKLDNKFIENSDAGGVNLLIVDADGDFSARINELDSIKGGLRIEFDRFLLPNHRGSGNLETLLIDIINPDHRMIFDCFDKYQDCLSAKPVYHLPNDKSKIYAYLEALLPPNKIEFLKDTKRNYRNTDHWNLDDPYLNPLRSFILSHKDLFV